MRGEVCRVTDGSAHQVTEATWIVRDGPSGKAVAVSGGKGKYVVQRVCLAMEPVMLILQLHEQRHDMRVKSRTRLVMRFPVGCALIEQDGIQIGFA